MSDTEPGAVSHLWEYRVVRLVVYVVAASIAVRAVVWLDGFRDAVITILAVLLAVGLMDD